MRRRAQPLVAAAFLAVATAAPALAQAMPPARAPTPSEELVEKAKTHDGTEIMFEGEAIGDPMPRGEGAWVNVSCGAYAIGIWLPRAELAKIGGYGSYGWKGDRLRVQGTFHRACPEHGGDLDIHAASIEVIVRGEAVPHPVGRARAAAAAALLAAGISMLALWRRRERAVLAAKRVGRY